MKGVLVLLSLLVSIICIKSSTSSSYLSQSDKDKFKSILENNYSKNPRDIKAISSVLEGYSILEKKFQKENDVCESIKSVITDTKDVNDVYFIVFSISNLKSVECKVDNSLLTQKIPKIDDAKTMEELYRIVFVMKFLGIKIENDITKIISILSKKEGGVALTQAYSYKIAVTLWSDQKNNLEKFYNEIEDTVQQADESDNIYLYYDNGLESTAIIVNSFIHLSNSYGKAPPVDISKIIKFSNFLLSRRHAYKLSTAVEVMNAIKTLGRNRFSVPISVVAKHNGVISPFSDAPDSGKLEVQLQNVWGDQLPSLKVKSTSVKQLEKGNEITDLSNKDLVPGSLPGSYLLDLTLQNGQRLNRGFYEVNLDVQPQNNAETRFEKSTKATIMLKVNTEAIVDSAQINIKEKDSLGVGALNYKLNLGMTLSDKLSVNVHHRLELTFNIHDRLATDESIKVMKPHQVFLKLRHKNSGQEIIFVVEADKTDNKYKYVLDLEKSAKDFDNLSGDYETSLIIGDALIHSPIQWNLATINLDITGQQSQDSGSAESRRSIAGSKRSTSPRIGEKPATSKPEIFHMFRPAEIRAGRTIATIFTVLCTLVPFGIMVIMWIILGVNVSNFPISMSALLFHGGLAGIFGLYYCYWKYLNMFTTLRYLMILGTITAFFGNRVLRYMAAKHTTTTCTQSTTVSSKQ